MAIVGEAARRTSLARTLVVVCLVLVAAPLEAAAQVTSSCPGKGRLTGPLAFPANSAVFSRHGDWVSFSLSSTTLKCEGSEEEGCRALGRGSHDERRLAGTVKLLGKEERITGRFQVSGGELPRAGEATIASLDLHENGPPGYQPGSSGFVELEEEPNGRLHGTIRVSFGTDDQGGAVIDGSFDAARCDSYARGMPAFAPDTLPIIEAAIDSASVVAVWGALIPLPGVGSGLLHALGFRHDDSGPRRLYVKTVPTEAFGKLLLVSDYDSPADRTLAGMVAFPHQRSAEELERLLAGEPDCWPDFQGVFRCEAFAKPVFARVCSSAVGFSDSKEGLPRCD